MMALFFCRSFHISNFQSYSSWMLLLFLMLTVISSTSIVPSLSNCMTKQRRQRQSNGDQWIAQALDSICSWAECQRWIGCTPISMPLRFSTTPKNFRELQPCEVPEPPRTSLGTCYGYSPPGKPAADDWCKDGPKKDECACINSEGILRIGYSEEERHPQDDAPIGDLCASRIISPCTTTAAPAPPITTTAQTTLPPTTSFTTPLSTTGGGPVEVSTGLLTSSTLTPSTTPTTPTAMNATSHTPKTTTSPTPKTATNRSANRVVPTGSSSSADNGPTKASTPRSEEGSNRVEHYFIWPPLLVVLICLLVALYRRRRRPSKIPAGVTVGFSAVNTSESPTTPSPRDDATVLNPSYERHVSGNELDRSGNFYCPPLDTIPRSPDSGRDRTISPGHDGEVHGMNAAAFHGHFNVTFSEGNYSDVRRDPEDASDEKLASHESMSPREVRYSCHPQEGEHSYPVDIVPSSQPASKVQSLSADGYEDAPVFSFVNYSTEATSGYEAATAYQPNANHLQNDTTMDNPNPRERKGADIHYEAVSPPAGHSPKSTGNNIYAYATTVVYPAGPNTPGGPQIVSDNQYNVLQTPVNENDGEYSMLKRSVGGSGSTSPHAPIVSSNEYNRLAIPLIKH